MSIPGEFRRAPSVDPSIRGAGVGEELLAWGRSRNPLVPLHLTVENDSEASREFAHRTGLVRVFAEDIMRHDLGDIPVVPRDPALIAVPWGTDTRAAFHHVWRQSFASGLVSRTSTWMRGSLSSSPTRSFSLLTPASCSTGVTPWLS